MRTTSQYKIAGTKTFRLASSKYFGHGGNLQNIKKQLRVVFVPDEGKIFVQVDQSGAEALIVAYCCPDGQYRKLFRHNIKPHSYLGMHLFKGVWRNKMIEHGLITSTDDTFDIEAMCKTPIDLLKSHVHYKSLFGLIKDSDDWPANERYYYLSKQTEHSSNYDIKAPMFRMNVLDKSEGEVVISKEDSELFLATKHSLFPEIREGFHRYVRYCIDNHKVIYNLHGHPFVVTQPEILESKWKEWYAIIPQSTVGEITIIAHAYLQEYIERECRDWDVLANTHDSLLVQCPIAEALECATIMQKFMNQSFKSPIDGAEFQMKSEASAGFNWRPFKPGVNDKGLKPI